MNAPEPRIFSNNLKALVGLAILFGFAQTLAGMWQYDPAYDEIVFYDFSERFLETGNLERESWSLWNSKTPANVANVLLGKYVAEPLQVSDRAGWFIKRIPNFIWYLALLWFTYLLGKKILGSPGSYILLALISIDPMISGHGGFIGADVPFAATVVLLVWSLLEFLQRPDYRYGSILGVAMGLCLWVKITAIVILPILGLVGLVFSYKKITKQHLKFLALSLILAILILNAGYGFFGFAKPFVDIPLHWTPLIKIQQLAPNLRLPVPEAWITMVDQCAAAERNRPRNIVLLNTQFPNGVWYSFPICFLLKTPFLSLLGISAGFYFVTKNRCKSREVHIITWFVFLVWLYFCFVFRNHKGYRYVLFTIPFFYLYVTYGWLQLSEKFKAFKPQWALAAIVLFTLAETTPYLGNGISFSNALLWNKSKAYVYLNDSNIDWNHNFKKIYSWMREKRIDYFRLTPKVLLPGKNVIQHNYLSGVVYFNRYKWLREHAEPSGHLHHTHLIYDLSQRQYQAYLESLEHTPVAKIDAKDYTLIQVIPNKPLKWDQSGEISTYGFTLLKLEPKESIRTLRGRFRIPEKCKKKASLLLRVWDTKRIRYSSPELHTSGDVYFFHLENLTDPIWLEVSETHKKQCKFGEINFSN
jgi:hypothetical protein